jgi:hypothetical protein
MKLVLMLLCLACCPVRCRVVAYLPRKAREPPASQGNLRTVRSTLFYHNMLILLHWQAQLLDALVQVK